MVTLLDIATVKQTLRYCTWLLQVTKDAFLQCDCQILKHLLTSLPKFIGETKEKKKKKLCSTMFLLSQTLRNVGDWFLRN